MKKILFTQNIFIPRIREIASLEKRKLKFFFFYIFKNFICGGFPGDAVVGVCLPMQGTRVRALVWEDLTCPEQLSP